MPKLSLPWWILSFCSLSLLFLRPSSFSADQLTHPPVQQSFSSASYRFTVTTTNRWQTPAATGQLYKNNQLQWQHDLPHSYGPRFTVVSPNGQVLLVDEFINVASPDALMLYDAAGQLIAHYSFEEIQQQLNLSRAELVAQASSGWWVSSPPKLSPEQDTVLIETGGTTLEIELATGELLL